MISIACCRHSKLGSIASTLPLTGNREMIKSSSLKTIMAICDLCQTSHAAAAAQARIYLDI